MCVKICIVQGVFLTGPPLNLRSVGQSVTDFKETSQIGPPLMIEKSASIHLDVFTKVNLILRRFRGGEGGTVEGFMGEPV